MTQTMDAADVAYAICRIGDIPNRRARGFSLLRRDAAGGEAPFHVVILRWDWKIHGYVNRCPHHFGPLDWEPGQFFDPGGTRLICGKHGALFEVESGRCVQGPCRGARLERLRLAILDGDICVLGIPLAEAAEDTRP